MHRTVAVCASIVVAAIAVLSGSTVASANLAGPGTRYCTGEMGFGGGGGFCPAEFHTCSSDGNCTQGGDIEIGGGGGGHGSGTLDVPFKIGTFNTAAICNNVSTLLNDPQFAWITFCSAKILMAREVRSSVPQSSSGPLVNVTTGVQIGSFTDNELCVLATRIMTRKEPTSLYTCNGKDVFWASTTSVASSPQPPDGGQPPANGGEPLSWPESTY